MLTSPELAISIRRNGADDGQDGGGQMKTYQIARLFNLYDSPPPATVIGIDRRGVYVDGRYLALLADPRITEAEGD